MSKIALIIIAALACIASVGGAEKELEDRIINEMKKAVKLAKIIRKIITGREDKKRFCDLVATALKENSKMDEKDAESKAKEIHEQFQKIVPRVQQAEEFIEIEAQDRTELALSQLIKHHLNASKVVEAAAPAPTQSANDPSSVSQSAPSMMIAAFVVIAFLMN